MDKEKKNEVKRKDTNAVEEEKKQYIICRIGDEQYGLDISYVDNIVRMQKITRVPKVQYYYIGIINLRGEVVPVMSVRRKMGLGEDEITNKSRIVILKMEDVGYVGILVDEVREVIALGESEINRNTKSKKQDNMFINGIGIHGDDLVSIFDISTIIDNPKA
ncbi:MAG: chemotaxis protein CheW [Lachnospiraceae bacterium]|uniref:Purine-binding chemotaxis protein CheW n=1 Tax=Candidatus Weimeria bifida TaxID=2599074 RepID=A0A6N7J074_9FIRM|nr:purine-binding chemotaxis protein CheW [Candidatus Weimeria bifida]RRF96313.1 MAG: chemotaxis protein CheW [Lachnospiraceae bacterium]